MELLQFKIEINAAKEKVWTTMLDDKTYREWVKAFHAGSYYEGSWNKGSEIRFIGSDENGKLQGMYSRIKENDLHQFISIEHLGIVSNGVIDTTSDEVKKWAPSFENYTFTEANGKTLLKVEMQSPSEYKTMFEKMWGEALQLLKALCEK